MKAPNLDELVEFGDGWKVSKQETIEKALGTTPPQMGWILKT